MREGVDPRGGAGPDVAVLTDLWPSDSEPTSGVFVRAQVERLGERFRHVVLVPRLVGRRLHARVWGRGVNGWQRGHRPPDPPHALLRYPMLRVPKVGEAQARAWGARAALAAARERPRLVHGHFLQSVAPAAVRVGRALGVPTVVTAHGTDARWLGQGVAAPEGEGWRDPPLQPRFQAEMAWACREATRVVAVHRGMVAWLAAAGVPEHRIAVIPMGVDEAVFRLRDPAAARRRLGVGDDGPVVLFVGQVTQELKGFAVLREALRRLAGESTRLRCYAAGSEPGRDQAFVGLGPLDAERLALWMSAADVVCVPSYAEGSPVVVAEALAAGTPVVASSVGGVPDQLVEGENGLLVAPGDPARLADALLAAVRREWSREALRASSEPFWWSGVGERLLRLYEEVLAGGPEARG